MDRIEEIDNQIALLQEEKEQIKSKQLLDKYAKFDSYVGKFIRKISGNDTFVFKPSSILSDEECFEAIIVRGGGLQFDWVYLDEDFELLTELEIKQIKMEAINTAIKDLNEFFK